MDTEQDPRPKKPAKKPRKKRTTKQKAAEMAIEQRREQTTKLRVAGWTVREIAGHLKVGLATVQRDLDAVLARTRSTADGFVEQQKAISLERLDTAMKGIWPSVVTGDFDAVDRLVRIEQRRAKTLGFDAPTKQELSGPDGDPIPIDARSQLLERLAGLVAGAASATGAGSDPQKPDGG
jgi:hypothetical protein